MKTAYSWLSLCVSAAMLAYMAYRYAAALSHRPAIAKADIVFQEWFASGCSMKNILTQLGGANNCVRLVITRELLWVTSWFPFSLLSAFYDMEHVIPLNRIISVETRQGWFMTAIYLSYANDDGDTQSLKLRPKNPMGFLRALGVE
jgi:hypothetical protein